MAPKRAAKKAAPPPPPAESSDETRSGSRSRSDESEDEDAIAESPVPAATPALKNAPAPAQKGDESESSDDGEEDDDEEEEEEEEEEEKVEKKDQPARASPKNKPPPPQEKEDSETSGDEEEDDEEEEEEEEEPTRAAPPSAPKKPPPQPAKKDDSDTSGEEEEEEAPPPPPPKPAPKKDAAALKPPALALAAAAADEAKKPGGFQRIWSTDDDVRILEALAAHQKQHGTFPQPDALVDVLAGKLDNHAYGSKELQSKVRSLKKRYTTLSRRGEVPSKEHDRRVLDLSKIVWDGDKTTITAYVSNGHEQKGFEEMCELYPYLAEEVKQLEVARPGMCKREFGKLDDDKARAMDEKIKKQRVVQIRVEMRRADLVKEVTKALMDVVDG